VLLLGHNANLLQVQAPAVPADPTLGIAGSPATTRWQGTCPAYIDEDIVDEIRGGMRVQVSQTIVDVPINLPVWPNPEDRLIFKRIDYISKQVPAQGGVDTTPNETLIVRTIDGGLGLLGKLRFRCVRD
jgi:hypothetical protein